MSVFGSKAHVYHTPTSRLLLNHSCPLRKALVAVQEDRHVVAFGDDSNSSTNLRIFASNGEQSSALT